MDKFEAARQLHCSPRRVAELCRNKTIRAKKPGKSWVISQQAIDEYLNRDENQECGSAVEGKTESTEWQSTAEVISIGRTSARQAADELNGRLEQLTSSQPKRRTTSLRPANKTS